MLTAVSFNGLCLCAGLCRFTGNDRRAHTNPICDADRIRRGKAMNLADYRSVWAKWLHAIQGDVIELANHRHLYTELRNTVATNPRLHGENVLWAYLVTTWAHYAAAAVRRQVKINNNAASMARLLKEISETPKAISLRGSAGDTAREVLQDHLCRYPHCRCRHGRWGRLEAALAHAVDSLTEVGTTSGCTRPARLCGDLWRVSRGTSPDKTERDGCANGTPSHLR